MGIFYYDGEGKRRGPVSFVQAQALVNSGWITPQTDVETENGERMKAQDVPDLIEESPFAESEEVFAKSSTVDPHAEVNSAPQPRQNIYAVSDSPKSPKVSRPRPSMNDSASTKQPSSDSKTSSRGSNSFETSRCSTDSGLSILFAWFWGSGLLLVVTLPTTLLFIANCILPFPKWLSVIINLFLMVVLLLIPLVGLVAQWKIYKEYQQEFPPFWDNVKGWIEDFKELFLY